MNKTAGNSLGVFFFLFTVLFFLSFFLYSLGSGAHAVLGLGKT